LIKEEFCILNEVYPREEYFRLVRELTAALKIPGTP
jgi:hypothetical protein